MEEQLKNLRLKIDGTSKEIKDLITNPRQDNNYLGYHLIELPNAYNSAIFAKAWLGKALGEIGVENPYKSGYKTKEDIEPTADVEVNPKWYTTEGDWSSKNHIEKVDSIRTGIDSLVKEIVELGTPQIGETTFTTTREFAIARTNSYNHLCEARFWLGFELQRIKEL